MAKSKTVSKSSGGYSGYSHNNISPGGQIYDRNTGTWVGEMQVTVGGGYTGNGIGRPSMVIHDANGPVGVKFAERPTPGAGAAAGVTSNGVYQAGAASVGASVIGPGAPAVATSAGGGFGPWAAPKAVSPTGGVLKTKLKPDNTSLMVGGVFIEAPPGFSNADQWEELLGEPGDWIGGIVVGAGTAYHNAMRLADFALGTDVLDRKRPNTFQMDSIAGKGSWVLGGAADWWAQANSPHGPDKPIWGFDGGGF